ncbi:MAG: adenylosuccinate synthase [Candidatus Caenarcaniphilales bacterium]|nr:adenylosuccinate synthase [Candidatus Caenarcaniphilales bacterium]
MVCVVISGGQWGDEGKAKITDLLSDKADFIVRYQGGANAGHTVSTKEGLFKFHLIPSGILFDNKTCIIGPGTVIEPGFLINEIENLKKQGINLQGLKISGLAHITMPWHIDIDKAADTVGSTGKGIGPTYTDKAKRHGIQLHDLLSEKTLREKLQRVLPKQNQALQKIHNLNAYSEDEIVEKYLKYGEFFKPYLGDVINDLYKARKDEKNILFEGAQGTLLDITFGSYPYVTSSTPVSGGACVGSGVGPTIIDKSIGVFKCFSTRVGDGPFPSELAYDSQEAIKLRQDGTQWAEFGTTTGRMRRVGWFDAVLAKYAVRVNSFTGIALTKLDTLDSFDEINICIAYLNKETGEMIQELPYASSSLLSQCEPVFQSFPGWNELIHGSKSWDSLPSKAQKYVELISRTLETPVNIVSTGPDREHSIFLDDIF